jgi:hypothetical protein
MRAAFGLILFATHNLDLSYLLRVHVSEFDGTTPVSDSSCRHIVRKWY